MTRVSKAIVLKCRSAVADAMGHADDKDVVDYRQHIMKSLEQQTAALGQILSGAGPDRKHAGAYGNIGVVGLHRAEVVRGQGAGRCGQTRSLEGAGRTSPNA